MFYKNELKDIVIAVLALTFIFSLAIGGYNLSLVPIFLFIVIVSFLFHELAHRLVATRFGYLAFFKLFPQGILFGILFAVFGFVLVAPGAVMIHPKGSIFFKSRQSMKREWGLIAAAGPLVNLFFAFIFLFFGPITKLAALINAWLAFFNLLPIPPLDGSKVMFWKWQVWILLIAIAGILLYLQWI
ncbi:MAG: M50 family metallopeptidase [Candidatus Aenigmarchaeota archaeon]|nr:M50 family metallopeptidase [Candidatus Aenigmarchaeota archaeon]